MLILMAPHRVVKAFAVRFIIYIYNQTCSPILLLMAFAIPKCTKVKVYTVVVSVNLYLFFQAMLEDFTNAPRPNGQAPPIDAVPRPRTKDLSGVAILTIEVNGLQWFVWWDNVGHVPQT